MSNWRVLGALGIVTLLGGSGCEHMSNTAKGVGIGGGLGAGVGALAGSLSGNAGKGAAIGGLVGGGLGGLVGNSKDMEEKREGQARLASAQAQAAAASARPPMTMDEVIHMAQNHVSDTAIINTIRSTGTTMVLNGYDVVRLQQSGVSDAVIEELQRRKGGPIVQASTVQPVIVQQQPVVVHEPVYVVPQRPVGYVRVR